MGHMNARWLAAGALALGVGAGFAVGSGTAHADGGASATEGARSTGAAAGSSAADSGQRVRRSSTATGSVSPRTSAADQVASPASSSVTAPWLTSRPAPRPKPIAQCQGTLTCGTQSFGPTGAPQTWTVPAGVQSVYVFMEGGRGGGANIPVDNINEVSASPGFVAANLQLTGESLPAPTVALSINVGTDGYGEGQGSPGQYGDGGFVGGGSGGENSLSGFRGAGGGGASTVATVTGDPSTSAIVLAAGGAGGYGGDRNGAGGRGGAGGGAQAVGVSPTPEGVWPGNPGDPGTSDDNPGAGGAGGTVSPGGFGTDGGDADFGSGNGGGGGGGGGWPGGGVGGQAGQAGFGPFSPAGAGGGGGGGASYANPAYTTSAVAGPSACFGGCGGDVTVNWVDILTPSLGLRAGVATNQQLLALSQGLNLDNPTRAPAPTWSVSAGALPAGLTLSPSGVLSGTPSVGPYSFTATVRAVADDLFYSSQADITSVITYSGNVCNRLCGRGGRT